MFACRNDWLSRVEKRSRKRHNNCGFDALECIGGYYERRYNESVVRIRDLEEENRKLRELIRAGMSNDNFNKVLEILESGKNPTEENTDNNDGLREIH